MSNLNAIRGKTVFLSKPYLQQFYTSKKPRWVVFCERLLEQGYVVVLHQAHNTYSKYITLIKNNKLLKIRWSNHAPNYKSWCKGEIKLYVGDKNKGMLSEGEVFNAARVYFRN